MILWPPLIGSWGGPWPLGPPPGYAPGLTDKSFNIVTVHRAGKNKTFFPTNHGSQLLRYKFIGFLKTAYWCMVVGGHSITTPRDLYTAYSTNQGTVRVYIKCLITTYRGICDPWLLGEKVLFPPILCTVTILKDLSVTPCIYSFLIGKFFLYLRTPFSFLKLTKFLVKKSNKFYIYI